MKQASLGLPQLISWSAADFKMESAGTTRTCCLGPPCDPSTEPVLTKQCPLVTVSDPGTHLLELAKVC